MHGLKIAPQRLEDYPTAGVRFRPFRRPLFHKRTTATECLFKKPIRHHTSLSAYFMPGNKPFIPFAMLISLRIFCPLNIFIIFCDCSNWFSILLTS